MPHAIVPALVLLAAAPPGDWGNAGGNAERNGRTQELGPEAPTLLWSGGRPSLIAWQPVTEGDRAFVVRQASFVPVGVPNDAPVVAYDLLTGAELWARDLPFQTGDWTTWIAGVRDGRVFASRGGNGASSSAPLYALDAATGAILWASADEIDAGAYDGVTFAPDGDPVVASFTDVRRIDAATGATLWQSPRTCSVSGACGGAVHGDAVYVADAIPGGHALKRFDLATGAFAYQSPLMPGFLMQNTPMVGPDGTVYLNRVQNNPAVDFLYAWEDTGAGFAQRWSAAAGYNTSVEYAVGPAGDVYMMGPGDVLQRLDPATGAVLDAFPLGETASVRMATDALGRVFVSNGEFASGRVFAFERDLDPLWSVPVQNVNVGAPALGQNGALVVAGVGQDLRVYRSPLAQDVHAISVAAGGEQRWLLHEPGSAGATYWVLGSASGAEPGIALGALTLPLQPDPYFLWTVTHPNHPILPGSLGVLDAQGDAAAKLAIPAGAPLAGLPLTVNHAFLVVDLAHATASFASNAAQVVLVP